MQNLFSMQAMSPYIGWSFGVTAALMILEVVLLRRRRRQLLQRLDFAVFTDKELCQSNDILGPLP